MVEDLRGNTENRKSFLTFTAVFVLRAWRTVPRDARNKPKLSYSLLCLS